MRPMATEKKPTKRRVPDSQRRRTLVSCDRCKTRRIRCCRVNENEPCTNCVNGGVACESTLPRKQRVYGSVERFSVRYRALDALVRGLFPSKDTDDIEVLFQLGRNHNIPMPSPEDQSPAPEAFNHEQPIAAGTPSADAIDYHTIKHDCSASEMVYERMVPGPHRILHYVGPSSSSEFASVIRHLVTKYKKVNSASHDHRRDHHKDVAASMPDSAATLNHVAQSLAQGHSMASAMQDEAERTAGNNGAETPYQQPLQPASSLNKRMSQDSGVETSRSLRNLLRDLLPDKSLCDVLVQAYLEHLHASFQVFYKPIFRLRYDFVWDNKIAQTGIADVGWSCCLFMVIVLGADIVGPEYCPDSIAIQTKYIKLIRDNFQPLAFTATLENVQALLLLQLYEQNSGERNNAWLVLGLATRMAITLGMHREGTYSSFDTVEAHTRRIVWWTLYQVEHNMSMILGRPPAINAREVNVLLPQNDVLDGPGYPVGFEEHYSELTNIGNRIRRLITTVTAKYADEQALLSHQMHVKGVLRELEVWKTQLPIHLTPESQGLTARYHRAVLLLQATYYHNRSVLMRTFLICKSNRHIDRLLQDGNRLVGPVSSITDLWSRDCRTSAIAVLDCFLQLAKHGLLEGVAWVDFYYICHSILALGLFALGEIDNSVPDPEHELSQTKIAEMMDIMARIRLAPTYKIFTKVSLGFARSVGLGIEKLPPSNEVRTLEGVVEDTTRLSTLDFPFTSAPYGQLPWSSAEMNAETSQPTAENMMSPPGLLGWFLQEANSGLHMSWDMFNLGNIQLTGAEYMEAPPQYSAAYTGQEQTPQQQQQQQQQQQHQHPQFTHWPG